MITLYCRSSGNSGGVKACEYCTKDIKQYGKVILSSNLKHITSFLFPFCSHLLVLFAHCSLPSMAKNAPGIYLFSDGEQLQIVVKEIC